MRCDEIKALLALLPDVREALGSIPGVSEFLERVRAAGAGRSPRLDEPDLLPWLYCAGLQREIEMLYDEFSEVADKREVVDAAERHWRAVMRARTSLLFRNDAGDLARLPEQLARLIASRGSFDGEVVERGMSVAFLQGDREIASVPKTLFVCLEDVLADWTWDKGASPSLSRDARPCGQVFPTGGASSPTRGTVG